MAGFRLAALTVAALLTIGCTRVLATRGSFEGTEWRVTAINGHVTPRSAIYQVQFRNGQFGGQFGCNNFGGEYSVGGEVLTVGPVTATEMACTDPAGTFEWWGFAVIRQPMRINWQADQRLTLSNGAGSIALELRR